VCQVQVELIYICELAAFIRADFENLETFEDMRVILKKLQEKNQI